MTGLRDEIRSLVEAAAEDHFYGAWKGGPKSAGGGPVIDSRNRGSSAKDALERTKGAKTPYDWGGDYAEQEVLKDLEKSVFKRPLDGKPNTVITASTSSGPGGVLSFEKHIGGSTVTHVVYRGDDGKPVGFVRLEQSTTPGAKGGPNEGKWMQHDRGIQAVSVLSAQRGKGYGIKMYDAIQDQTSINLYDHIGVSRSFTENGKAFATKWLEHRIEMEAA